MKTKILALVLFITVVVSTTSVVKAQTAVEIISTSCNTAEISTVTLNCLIKQLIEVLMAQVQILQAQLTTLQNATTTPQTIIQQTIIQAPIPPSVPEVVDQWVSDNRYAISPQPTMVIASSSPEFEVWGRLVEQKTKKAQAPPTKWFPIVNEPVTFTYGDQTQIGITNSNGVATVKFHALGIEERNKFTFSSKYSIYNSNFWWIIEK